MFETICDINRLHLSNPFFYTPKYLQNNYVKANDLAKHIHLFNHQISRIDYSLFGDLKGNIYKLSEKEKVYYYDNAIRSNPFDLTNTVYSFNKNLELLQVLVDKTGSECQILFFDSLKIPGKLEIIESFDYVNSSRTEIIYNSFLEFEKIEETSFCNGMVSNWLKPSQRNTKYFFKENGQVLKTHTRNNRDEQSKSTIIYDSNFQILESKTYSQKNKLELLYEAIFNYENNKLVKIIYITYKSKRFSDGDIVQELIFEYNQKGLLAKLIKGDEIISWIYDKNENPILVKESDINGNDLYQMTAHYKYDKYNNWIYKREESFREKIKIYKKELFREIEYF